MLFCRFVNAYFGYGIKFSDKQFSPLLPGDIEPECDAENVEAQDVKEDPTPPEPVQEGEPNGEGGEGGDEEEES